MRLNPSPTELTTAGTDIALGVLCLGVLLWLLSLSGTAGKRAIWAWVFGLLLLASALGALAHGLTWSESVLDVLWQPLYLALGLAVALFLVGGLRDWRGEAAARAAFPWAIGLGVGFFALTRWFSTGFVVFVAYEAAAMLAALAIYLYLEVTGRLPGAGMVSLGIGLTLVAAAVQISHLSLRVLVPFDHNGLFHLVQLIATAVMVNGLRMGLAAARRAAQASRDEPVTAR